MFQYVDLGTAYLSNYQYSNRGFLPPTVFLNQRENGMPDNTDHTLTTFIQVV
ncbi:hypothetical protein B5T_03181 [Alloalcanivorax dieselolei B5]|uniref:Uncharacterized protein n=1 Tax=Alcanivorax dieselolei (strain DSM 16502 / CGMCC 1.3690 / MCCC 1A00001 / B-5) TaxID=930169 RepID=K0CFK7_ALCDB|nr:hypothetical protein B5T_03181 [Alloalcanivorax dieselolei B5]